MEGYCTWATDTSQHLPALWDNLLANEIRNCNLLLCYLFNNIVVRYIYQPQNNTTLFTFSVSLLLFHYRGYSVDPAHAHVNNYRQTIMEYLVSVHPSVCHKCDVTSLNLFHPQGYESMGMVSTNTTLLGMRGWRTLACKSPCHTRATERDTAGASHTAWLRRKQPFSGTLLKMCRYYSTTMCYYWDSLHSWACHTWPV